MNVFEKDIETIIEHLASGHPQAIEVLKRVPTPPQLRLLAIDLDDMQMSAQQIVHAFIFSENDINQLIVNCAKRDEAMIEFVNYCVTDRKARKGAPQTTSPQVDAAVKDILTDAENTKNLKRLDEGADYVHKFFMTMMTEMQKRKEFSGNFRLNVAGMVEGAAYANFRITMVALVDADGKELSIEQQPTKEDARIGDALLEAAAMEGAKKVLEGLGERDDEAGSAMQDTLTRVTYALAVHEAALKRMTHQDFKDDFADWRWAYAVTLKEMAQLVDGMVANGTEIDTAQLADFKAGNAFLRINGTRVVPELEEIPTSPQLNG